MTDALSATAAAPMRAAPSIASRRPSMSMGVPAQSRAKPFERRGVLMDMPRILLACALALGLAGTAVAAEKAYVVKILDEPASRGLPVAKPLAEFVATSRARVLVPSSWKARGTTQF